MSETVIEFKDVDMSYGDKTGSRIRFSFAAADDQLAQAVKNIAAAMAQIGEKV